jgi:hypothetical protein
MQLGVQRCRSHVFELLKDPSRYVIRETAAKSQFKSLFPQNEEERRYENKRDALSFLYSPAPRQIERGSEMPWALNPGPIVTIISTEQGDGASQIESGDRENQPLAWDSRSPFFLLPTTKKRIAPEQIELLKMRNGFQ